MSDWALYKKYPDDKRYVSIIFEQNIPTRLAMQVEFHLLICLFLFSGVLQLWPWTNSHRAVELVVVQNS